ncbi:MAG TPA: CPBP family intramembrane glutamic endopeptidase [Candidatus Udaeobacter sp.]|nr:CPBP family intramembrane glutamic endopeptidase [Candidatus Udaeobacter sp.]
MARRRVGIALPAAVVAPGGERRAHIEPGTPFSWRSPLGLLSGLVVTLADDGLGWLGALVVARLGFGTLAPVLDLEIQGRASAISALAGTGLGNLGTGLLLAWLYRRQGVSPAGAGLAPPPKGAFVLAVELALGMFLLSVLHDLAFDALLGRPPVSNVEPLLTALFSSGPRLPATIGLALVVVGIAPVVEELVYRGVVFRAFRDRAGVGMGIVGSALVFTIAHFEPDHFLPLFMIGAALAWICQRTSSLLPAIVLHAIYNAMSLGLYLGGNLR